MATISATKSIVSDYGDESIVILWTPLTTTNDVGDGQRFTEWPVRSVQVLGTFGAGGTLVIEGSNDGGTTWATLNDPQGNALSFTAAKIEGVQEITRLIRPKVTAGDGTTSLSVYLLVQGISR